MDNKFPFTNYDFWAYLSAGLMFLFAVDQVMGKHLLMRDSWTVVQGTIAVSVAYTVGQLIASLSAWIFEKLLVGKLLGYPRNVLFGQPRAWGWVQRLLPTYFEPLPAETQKAIIAKGAKIGVSKPGDALFWPAHTAARLVPAVAARLDNFLNLYGFCRNVAFVGFTDAAILYGSYLRTDGSPEFLLWAQIAFVIGIGMTLRYLKFFRHFALEVFTSYIFAKAAEKTP